MTHVEEIKGGKNRKVLIRSCGLIVHQSYAPTANVCLFKAVHVY